MGSFVCLILCVILISSITAEEPDNDCGPYPDINNAEFKKDHQCEDVEITCSEGYKMEVVVKCEHETWIYHEPVCTKDCNDNNRYNITEGVFVDIPRTDYVTELNETECTDECLKRGGCGGSLLSNGDCILFTLPVVSATGDTTRDQCLQKCTALDECLVLEHNADLNECLLFNATLAKIKADIGVVPDELNGDIIVAEKLCTE